jgi:hypothetical protein
MENYPEVLAQDAAYQSHTGRLTGLWFLPKLALGLNTDTTTTNNNNNNTTTTNNNNNYVPFRQVLIFKRTIS